MKSIYRIVCVLVLSLCLMATPSFANDVSHHSMQVYAEESLDFSAIHPYATSKELWYRENIYFDYIENALVFPEKGSALNVWLKNTSGAVNITVYKTNAVGLYTKVYSQTFSEGERDVNVVSSCNGKQYLVKFTAAAGGSIMSALVYQH